MGRASKKRVTVRQFGSPAKPDQQFSFTGGENWIFQDMKRKGRNGATTRDFLSADLRHCIRNLIRKGVAIDCRWEKNEMAGQHKRWWLREGFQFETVLDLIMQKPATELTGPASNPISKLGGTNKVHSDV